jgi:hypothetical protein
MTLVTQHVPHEPTSPDIPNAVRQHWSREVRLTCLRHCESLKIIPERHDRESTDLSLIPGWLYDNAFAKCQQTAQRACEAEVVGHRRPNILRQVNTELWSYLVCWRQDGFSDFVVTQHQAANM